MTYRQSQFAFDCRTWQQYKTLGHKEKWFIADPYTTTSITQAKYWKIKLLNGTCDYLLDNSPTNAVWDYILPDIDMNPVATPIAAPQILIPKDSARAREATERARALLKSVLTLDQWREYEQHGTITISSQSGVRYRLDKRSRVRNITRLGPGGNKVELLCCHPLEDLPIEDVLLAQKLHLECAEESFRKTANITPAHLFSERG